VKIMGEVFMNWINLDCERATKACTLFAEHHSLSKHQGFFFS